MYYNNYYIIICYIIIVQPNPLTETRIFGPLRIFVFGLLTKYCFTTLLMITGSTCWSVQRCWAADSSSSYKLCNILCCWIACWYLFSSADSHGSSGNVDRTRSWGSISSEHNLPHISINITHVELSTLLLMKFFLFQSVAFMIIFFTRNWTKLSQKVC